MTKQIKFSEPGQKSKSWMELSEETLLQFKRRYADQRLSPTSQFQEALRTSFRAPIR